MRTLTLGAARPHPARAHGDLRVWRDVELPGLGRTADLPVWVPRAAGEGTPCPVVYLHDGHNQFDPATSTGGTTWAADRALATLEEEGLAAIAVAVPCHPTLRSEEYTPWAHPQYGGGRADDYVTALLDHLKPAVDATLPTLPDPEHTVVLGASLGGVVSLHAWLSRPDVVGGVGLLSPAFWWSGDRQLDQAEQALRRPPPGRVYLDVGGRENPWDAAQERAYVQGAERLLHLLRGAGTPVRYVYDSAAGHHESAWAARLPDALRWLLSGYAVNAPRTPDES